MWSFRGVWFPTCNLNYMSNMFNDAMQRQRCLINSRWTIWTCRCLTTGFWHQKMGCTVGVRGIRLDCTVLGHFEWQVGVPVMISGGEVVEPPTFSSTPKMIFLIRGVLCFQRYLQWTKKALISDVCKSRFFFPRGGLFRLVKKTPRKTCGWFFGDISDGGLLVSPDGWWTCCWYDATYIYI